MNYEALLRSEGMPPELPLLVDMAAERIDEGPLPAYEAHEQKLVSLPLLEQHTAVDTFFDYDQRGEYEYKTGQSFSDRVEDETQGEDQYYGGSAEVRGILIEAAHIQNFAPSYQHRHRQSERTY